jgi:hypothetical protein
MRNRGATLAPSEPEEQTAEEIAALVEAKANDLLEETRRLVEAVERERRAMRRESGGGR